MERITITLPKNNTTKELLLSLLKELKIKFEFTSSEKYSKEEFEEIIKQGREDIKNGRTTEMTMEELKNYLGL